MLKSVVRKQGPSNSVTSIRTRATLVVVIGTILGVGLSLGGGLLTERRNLSPDELAADQAQLLAEAGAKTYAQGFGYRDSVIHYSRERYGRSRSRIERKMSRWSRNWLTQEKGG